MKVCVIKNEYYQKKIGYLLYFDKNETFYIELLENVDKKGMPLIMRHFYEMGIKSVDAYWSKKWVEERIIPKERQNISSIIKDNNLKKYDEYKLLLLGRGRCSQDECCVEEINVNELPNEIKERFKFRLQDCLDIGEELMLIFQNGEVKKINIQNLKEINDKMSKIINNKDLFLEMEITPGGYAIEFIGNIILNSEDLYQKSKKVNINFNDIKKYISEKVVNTIEAAEIMNCSRQNINDLVKRKKVIPLKKTLKGQLFLKNELEEKMW